MNMKKFLPTAILSAALLAGGYYYGNSQMEKSYNAILADTAHVTTAVPTSYTSTVPAPIDFQKAAETAVPSVVHIKTITKARQVTGRGQQNPFGDMFGDNDMFKQFFGDGGQQFSQPEQRASGSGVIMSSDGYIVTNNHVVDGATDVTVTLSSGNKSYKAKVIGTDASTDLALIKIDANNLPVMPIGNSDEVHLGQGVLAIGYPLNLDVTVTQGIVSAKSRNLGINSRGSDAPIESFIQTDAAVNPGSSGGALVNVNGELIGINSAIASPTGSYAGYAYAIPSNLMKKVIGDIMKFGSVQRGYLGISYMPATNLDDAQKKELGITGDANGVYVMDVDPQGAAGQAGIQKGDAIISINGIATPAAPQMVEQIARHKPGDKLTITVQRGNEQKTFDVTLKGKAGSFATLSPAAMSSLGLAVKDLSKEDAAKLGITGGVQVTDIKDGVISNETNMKPGFIITNVAGRTVKNVAELKAVLANVKGNFQIQGVYPDSNEVYYYGVNGLNK